MAWEDIAERLEGLGWLGAGIGAIIVAPALVPAVARGLRPMAKGAIKGYLTLSEKARELIAESGEQWQDLIAEAKAEHESQAGASEAMMTMEQPAEGSEERGAAPPGEAEHHRPRARSGRGQEEPKPEPA